MKKLFLLSFLFIFSQPLSFPAGPDFPPFSLPQLKNGVVLQKSYWDRSGYEMIKTGKSGPGLLITSPPAEEKIVRYRAIRLSGRVEPSTRVEINGRPVRIHPTGSFVDLLPLEIGENVIEISAEDEAGETEFSIELQREEFIPYRRELKKLNRPLRGRVIKANTALQFLPDRTRLLTLDEGTIRIVVGRGDEYLQVELAESLAGCVLAEDVEVKGRFPEDPFTAGNVLVDAARGQALFFVQTSTPARVDYVSPSELKVIFYNSIVDTEEINLGDGEASCHWVQEQGGQAAFRLSGPLSCYRWDLAWKDDSYQLTWRGRPRKKDVPLVLIDPGHGGEEPGAVSPLGIEEKEANLVLGREVARSLAERGIKCVLSREKDISLSLNSRVDLARRGRADILLSLHHNSLPEEEDPRKFSGCTVFYYNPPSRELAALIHRSLKELGLPGNGVRWKSLAVIRPTDLIAVLVEISYLTNPDDEARLLDPDLRRETARAIADAIGEYLKNNQD